MIKSKQTRNIREQSHFVKRKTHPPPKSPTVNIILNSEKLVIVGNGGNLNRWSHGDFLELSTILYALLWWIHQNIYQNSQYFKMQRLNLNIWKILIPIYEVRKCKARMQNVTQQCNCIKNIWNHFTEGDG